MRTAALHIRNSSSGVGTLTRQSGQAMLEFACMVTVALIVLFGLIDFGRALFDLKVMTGLSRQGGNLASRGSSVSEAASAVIAGQAPLNFSSYGEVIVTSIQDNKGAYTITGQSILGGMSPAQASRVGTGVGATATLPASAQGMMQSGTSIYVAEIFYSFQPITPIGNFMKLAMPSTLYEVAYF